MKKLTLKLDELSVQSYETEAPIDERGTVEAQSLPTAPLCTRSGCQSGYCNTVTCTLELCC